MGPGGLIAIVAFVAAVTGASYGHNIATDDPHHAGGLRNASSGGSTTRYLWMGNHRDAGRRVPGAFETADTFYLLQAGLASGPHRLYAIDLTAPGTQRAKPAVQRGAPGGPRSPPS